MFIVMLDGLGPKLRTGTREAADASVANAANRIAFIVSVSFCGGSSCEKSAV